MRVSASLPRPHRAPSIPTHITSTVNVMLASIMMLTSMDVSTWRDAAHAAMAKDFPFLNPAAKLSGPTLATSD